MLNDVDIRSSCTCCDFRWLLVQHALVFESDSMTCETIAFKDISVFFSFPSYCNLDTEVVLLYRLLATGMTLLRRRGWFHLAITNVYRRKKMTQRQTDGWNSYHRLLTPNPNVYPNPTQMFYRCRFCDSGPLIWRPIAPRFANLFCCLFYQSIGFLHSSSAHQSVFTSQWCFDSWSYVRWIPWGDGDGALRVEVV